jgi:hypothetical protein
MVMAGTWHKQWDKKTLVSRRQSAFDAGSLNRAGGCADVHWLSFKIKLKNISIK